MKTKDPTHQDIGVLFWWIDKLGYEKWIHPVTISEISSNQDAKARKAFLLKMKSYRCLPSVAPLRPEIQVISEKYDRTENDKNDTILINEILCGRVDLLISEDKNLHLKALELGIDTSVFSVDEFLAKVRAENPELLDYNVLSVRRIYFGNINQNDPFFDSFREDYVRYDQWFNKKSTETAYVCKSDERIVAFLYVKLEDASEPYEDITPPFSKKRRLKIGAFKVQSNGFKLGERLLKIVFDNALHLSVNEIYVTIFRKRDDQLRLIDLLTEFGFVHYGINRSASGEEEVYVRNFIPSSSVTTPKRTFPFLSGHQRKFIVSIRPEYHTNLFPDSILRTESPMDYVENEPYRNAISKVYVSRSLYRDLRTGDSIVFYRTGGKYKGVVTTIGIVENVNTSISDPSSFIRLCRKRSVFSDVELRQQWEEAPSYNKPFIVNFLYAYSLPKRIILKRLIELGIIKDLFSAPRGFEEISSESFNKIMMESGSDRRIVVN